jgi:hypothetical protein
MHQHFRRQGAAAAPPRQSLRFLLGLLPLCAAMLAAPPGRAEPPPPPAEAVEKAEQQAGMVVRELCELVETAARDNNLPIAFFTRLLWKESRFHHGAISPKGAQGIAQFMPGTAAERGLVDPFDPIQAVPASASYLRDLKAQFGNLGLAAAAYNAGAGRVASWMAGDATLPWETQDYVLSITGEPPETWASPELGPTAAAKPAAEEDCVKLAGVLKVRGIPAAAAAVETASGPWGAQVTGNFSQAKALASYKALQRKFPSVLGGKPPMIVRSRLEGRGARAFYRIRVPAQSRDAAGDICQKLEAAGGACIVLKT